ncbi:SGNH/GDSL hydrolase family protein [Novosphingobium lentum]|uniref:SGNH/GDSL hydrolase family protein n=1 Tax=Novosphingobium lentum TaxID=145287 RepID=UPI000A95D451|nr:SGNH/GDSL hydrolase family protein [Novosphingobium lentum]
MTILAAGNGDVRDCLHALRENGAVTWNGINTVLRTRNQGWSARVIHRTVTRSDAILASDGTVPVGLIDRPFPADPFSVRSQFAGDLFERAADVVVLSIQSDVMNTLCRHRDDRHLLYAYDLGDWPDEARQWLVDHYAPVPLLGPDESMRNLERIVARIRERRQPHILIFNMSAAIPWERVRCYRGLPETLGERIRRFNLALIDLSRSLGIAIVDVDAVVASAGAERLKIDPATLTAEGCRLVAEEVAGVLQEIGAFERADAA